MVVGDEIFKIEDIHKGVSKGQNQVTNRKKSSLIFRVNGSVRYTFSNFFLDVHPGEMAFLPKDSTYTFTTLSDAPCEYIAIRFDRDVLKTTPSKYSIEAFHDIEDFTNNITDLWKFGSKAEHYKCYSIIYNLLAHIENLETSNYIDKTKYNTISPALSYLKNNIYNCNLKIETLHNLCGISDTYFRRIFHSKYGVSPQKYVLLKRLSYAKTLIDSGDFDTICEIANVVGFNDPLYFSRIFKKTYGVSPSNYIKE